jgi:hypothetical protein
MDGAISETDRAPIETVESIRVKATAEAKAEAKRVCDIRTLARAYNMEDRERLWISTNASLDAVRQEILADIFQGARGLDAAWMPLFPGSEPDEPQSRRNVRPRTSG